MASRDGGAFLIDLDNLVLVVRMRVGLDRGNEAAAHPDALGTERYRGDQAAPIGDTAGREHRHTDRIDHLGYQRHGADAAGMPSGLVPLRDDDIDARGFEPARLLDVAA